MLSRCVRFARRDRLSRHELGGPLDTSVSRHVSPVGASDGGGEGEDRERDVGPGGGTMLLLLDSEMYVGHIYVLFIRR